MTSEPVSIEAYQVAKLIMREWSDSYSDNGAIWQRSRDALLFATKNCDPEVISEAYRIAREKWDNHDYA